MQPIYENLIKMWQDNGFNYPICTGKFWLDNSIIKGYDKKGNLMFLYRVTIKDDLTISFKKHSKCPDFDNIEFETWIETANRIKPDF